MADKPFVLGFGVTYDTVAGHTACGQLLTLTSHGRNVRIPPHRHANDYLCIVLGGGFAETQGTSLVERQCGSFFAHNAGEIHHDRFGPRGAMCVNLHFASGDELAGGLEGRCTPPLRLAATELGFELARASRDELAMAALAAEIMASTGPDATPRDDGAWLGRIVEAIADEPRRRWTLGELAGVAGRHPVHVAQAFRQRTGMSLGAFQRIRRLLRLSIDLRGLPTPLAMLAAEFGYYDQSHMNLEFRAAFGVSPGSFRHLH